MPVCYADQFPTYQPAMRIISDITKAESAEVTTTFDHNFISGEIVRIIVPRTFGMNKINGRVGTVTVTGDTTFTIDINTLGFSSFSEPVDSQQCAQVVPIGEINSILRAATKNVLPSGDR